MFESPVMIGHLQASKQTNIGEKGEREIEQLSMFDNSQHIMYTQHNIMTSSNMHIPPDDHFGSIQLGDL
jgi:hypothetical protein